MNIDLEKLKEWLCIKADKLSGYDDEDGWSHGQSFAYEWVYAILTNEEDYQNMLKDLENK